MLVVLGLVALRGIAVTFTNYLWFGSVGLASVWRNIISTRAALALVFSGIFALSCWISLAVAQRMAQPSDLDLRSRSVDFDGESGVEGPEGAAALERRVFGSQDDVATRYRGSIAFRHPLAVRNIVSVVLGVLVGVGASAEWNNWILFDHAVSFGITDPVFHRDVGFFVFRLPFLSFVAGWAFVALLVLVLVTAAAHYLGGGIRLQGPDERVSGPAKAQLSVLFALIALAKAGGYYLARFQLDISTNGYAEGAFYSSVHAKMPALTLLIFVALASMFIFVLNIGRRGWVLP
ncbi:MAG: UPF0182 family protein, partial [Streptosporangiaceae bacterium]